MKKLNNEELLETNGGWSLAFAGAIIIGVTFLASIVYGFVHPNKC